VKLSNITLADLQRPETLSLIGGYLASIGLAVGFGYLIANNSWRMLSIAVVLTATILAAVRLQRRVWILIAFGWLLSGKLLVLPLPFAVRDLMILLALMSYIGYRVVSHRRLRVGWNVIDGLLAVNLIYVAFGYFLHPVGFLVFGSETIGARPYIDMALALVGYWLLVHLPESAKPVSRIPYYFLAAAALLGAMEVLVTTFPPLTRYVYGFYSAVDTGAYFRSISATGRYFFARLTGLAPFGLYVILTLCAYYPLASLFNLRKVRFYMFLIAGMCILASGYRGYAVSIVASMGVAGFLTHRWRDLAIGAIAATTLVGLLILGQGRLYDLPPEAQRALCFLPGRWSADVAWDAKNSTEWRVRIWKDVFEQHLIKNWWLGDGFGVSARSYREQAVLATTQRGAAFTEFSTEVGAYHSGPLTTVRYVGIIGLILLYVLTIGAAIYAYKTVQRCRGTVLYPAAMFVAMQLIWDPISYAFVFGAYGSYMPDVIIMLGLLRLLMRFCDEGLAVPATAQPDVTRAAVPNVVWARV
jgi:hypothetical protein